MRSATRNRRPWATLLVSGQTVKLILIILLGSLVLLVGLPLIGADMDMDPCPACASDDMSRAWGMCLALLTAPVLVVRALRRRLLMGEAPLPLLLLVHSYDRPPRPR